MAVTAKIAQLGIRHSREWPAGALGAQVERAAQLLASRARDVGQPVPAERFRRALVSALQSKAER